MRLLQNNNAFPPYPDILDTKGLKREHWNAIAKVCNITVTRTDNKRTSHRVSDIQQAIISKGTWDEILAIVEEKNRIS